VTRPHMDLCWSPTHACTDDCLDAAADIANAMCPFVSVLWFEFKSCRLDYFRK
jgi:hypothetical protein